MGHNVGFSSRFDFCGTAILFGFQVALSITALSLLFQWHNHEVTLRRLVRGLFNSFLFVDQLMLCIKACIIENAESVGRVAQNSRLIYLLVLVCTLLAFRHLTVKHQLASSNLSILFVDIESCLVSSGSLLFL